MKQNDAVLRRYCRAVGKRLPLPAAQRRQLLAGLREELTEAAPDCAELNALTARFGSPDETAQELLSGIAPERVQAHQKRQRVRYLLAAVLAVLLIGGAALIYAQVMTETSVAYAESHIVEYPAESITETDH